MSDRTRTALAFILIIGILLLWTLLSKPKTPEAPTQAPIIRDTIVKPSEQPPMPKEPDIIKTHGDTILIDKKEIRVVLSSVGGSVRSFYLKRHDVDMVPEDRYFFLSMFDVSTDSIIDFDYLVFKDSVIFTCNIENKEVRKTYRFNNDYGFQLTINAPGMTQHSLSLRSGLNITELKNRGEDLRHFNVYVKDEKVNSITKKIKDEYKYSEEFEWFALRSKYFVLIINNLAGIETINFYKIPKDIDDVGKEAINESGDGLHLATFGCYYMRGGGNRYGAEIIGSNEIDISVMLLPNKYSELSKFEKKYEDISGGGLLGPISRFFLLIFNFLYSIIKNYGFVIMLFGIIIKSIFFPLSRQMIKSQQQMQMIQPELKKIQQKYKDNPQKLNQEMMHLYKTYKVNPFSGCLPLLIQMPIFFALYQTLITSIEFRQANFIFWITDLSLKDPYYVLPVGMGIMMLIQSLKTTVDPRQRLMVIFMPILLVFIFLNLPSGLQLYWFTYNILTLVEHYITKRGGIK